MLKIKPKSLTMYSASRAGEIARAVEHISSKSEGLGFYLQNPCKTLGTMVFAYVCNPTAGDAEMKWASGVHWSAGQTKPETSRKKREMSQKPRHRGCLRMTHRLAFGLHTQTDMHIHTCNHTHTHEHTFLSSKPTLKNSPFPVYPLLIPLLS